MDEARAMIEVLAALAEKDTAAFDEDELRMVIQEAREIAENALTILRSKREG